MGPQWREAMKDAWRGVSLANAVAGMVAGAGGTLAIGIMEWFSLNTRYPLAAIPFATSIVLVIGAPEAEPAQPRALIGGHLVSTMVGLAVLKVTGPTAWAAALAVGLQKLESRLDQEDHWNRILSLGEQQRLAFARIHLLKPALIFMDEPTSALDELTEAQLYRLLRAASWRPTVVSVSHRSTLRIFHDQVLDVRDFSPPREQPVSIPGAFLDPQPAFDVTPLTGLADRPASIPVV